MKMCQLPTNHDVGRMMASLPSQNAPQGTFNINLVVLVVILLLNGTKFLGVPLEGMLCSCPSDLLQSRSKEVSL
jgi:hypothetical protein